MKLKKNLLLCILLFVGFFKVTALIAGSTHWGYGIDFPELWFLEEKSEEEDRFRFSHGLIQANLYIALYKNEQFNSALEALHHVNQQIDPNIQEVGFTWHYTKAAIGQVESKTQKGWTLAIELKNQKGWIVLAGVYPNTLGQNGEDLIISTLDSVFIDSASYNTIGPMTWFAWHEQGEIHKTITFEQKQILTSFNTTDTEASQSVVDREFRLLTHYLNQKEVYAAWARFYRIIYRDSYERIKEASFLIGTRLPEDQKQISQKLLSWTQDFIYERNQQGSDFVNIPQALQEQKGDCDSRALLMVLVLHQLGIDAILLISPEYQHALIGIDIEGEGARFESNGKKYLLGDTTAKVALGLIPATMADSTKWIPIHFD